MTGVIFDIKEMAVHDGPGIRTTVFFKGCPLRCMWCHNPEGLSPLPQLYARTTPCTHCGSCRRECDHAECAPHGRCIYACPQGLLEIKGRRITPRELASELIRGANILGDDFGGFTFSGGEPLLQSDFLIALSDELRGYHLAVETSGYADEKIFSAVIDRMNLVIMDVKLADGEQHKIYTGKRNEIILSNLALLKASGKPHIIRTPLIPGITDTDKNLSAIAALIGDSQWEKLPYNAAAGAKYASVGMKYELE
jgi:pyruvate formate lyase activating enzyme